VRLPIDFGDGVVHYPGETVEPDAKKAEAYRHALEVIETDADALARSIRQIRARLGLTLMKFGKLVGVTHTQISRYESGSDTPGYRPLSRLLMLAEGAEKNPFLKHLEIPPLLETAEKYGLIVPGRKGVLESRPNLASFALAASQICERGKELDASLAEILRLWLAADDSDPAARQRFADAATYLRVEHASKSVERPRPRRKKTGK